MKFRTYLFLFLISAATLGITAFFQMAPGYMDADYYFATALRIVKGEGFTEPFMWNYLGDFQSVIHPSHAYWHPLTTLISSFSMILAGSDGFLGGKWVFLLIAALVSPLSSMLAYKISNQKRTAVLAGIIACFPVFYLPMMPITDSFSPLMILGTAFYLVVEKGDKPGWAFLLGALVGAMHLARTEGLIWVGIAFLAMYMIGVTALRNYAALLAGYLIVFGPWMIRNSLVFGNPLGTGNLPALWLTDYDQLFVYPASRLNPKNWFAQGLIDILQDRIWSLGLNVKTAVFVQGQLFLFPLLVVGMRNKWKNTLVKMGLIAWLILFILMTVLFPFQGARGGFFHAGAALQPLIWVLSAVGFSSFIDWGVERRSWIQSQAWRTLGIGLVLLSFGTSVFVVKDRVVGEDIQAPRWNESFRQYQTIGDTLVQLGAEKKDVVMINNPPGFYVATRFKSIVVPDGDLQTLLQAANKYQAEYLVLDRNVPQGLRNVYQNPENNPGLTYLQTENGVHYFKIDQTGESA